MVPFLKRMEQMRRLIVNADDLGMAPGINRAIAEAHARGIVTSASLLANGAAFADAVDMTRHNSSLGVGVHLNLTEGRPLARETEVPALVDHRGMLRHTPLSLAAGLASRRIPAREVERELRAQVEKVIAAGIRPTHFDGHKHIHMLPWVLRITAKLAREFGIGAMRCSAERPVGLGNLLRRNSPGAVLAQYAGGRVLAAMSFACDLRGILRRAGLAAPDYFFGLSHTGFLDAESLAKILYNLPPGTSELMCHPGYAGAALRSTGTRLAEQRERELAALVRPEMRQALERLRVELISYGELWHRD
jgi:hopanoid biosynthesis associated protein HpnK